MALTQEFLTGTMPPAEPDRVVLTVLFTDIVGSTARATELGDRRWRRLLEEHDAVVRSNLARFRGREVETTGDGFLATFDGPARAIRAAAAMRDELAEQGLPIRVGMHTGEVELDGDHIRGIAVHIAARVLAAGRRRGDPLLAHGPGPGRRARVSASRRAGATGSRASPTSGNCSRRRSPHRD